MPKCPIQNLWTIVPATFSLLENFHAQFKFGAHFRFYLGPISLHTTSFSSSARPTGNRVRAPRSAEPPPRFHIQSDLLRLQRRALECLPSRLLAPSSLELHAADLVTRRPCLALSRRLFLYSPAIADPSPHTVAAAHSPQSPVELSTELPQTHAQASSILLKPCQPVSHPFEPR